MVPSSNSGSTIGSSIPKPVDCSVSSYVIPTQIQPTSYVYYSTKSSDS